MKSRNTVGTGLLRNIALLSVLTLTLVLAGCSFGNAEMPNVDPGLAADRTAGLVAPVPAPIPHPLEGRQECSTCHAIGAVEAPPVPADHEGDVELCGTCHAVWLAPVIAAAAPPAISHDLVGRDDCLMCHKQGTAGTPRVPENHSGLTSNICQTCHTPVEEFTMGDAGAGTSGNVPSPIPHALEGFGTCTLCHETGSAGVPQFPDDHKGRTDDLCSACHKTASEAPEAADAESAEVAPAGSGDANAGQDLYATDCAVCHGPMGEGTSIAPEALNDPAFLSGVSDEELVTVIRAGVPGKMPAMAELSDLDVVDLIAFLRSWQ